jgi:hypothetical protein
LCIIFRASFSLFIPTVFEILLQRDGFNIWQERIESTLKVIVPTDESNESFLTDSFRKDFIDGDARVFDNREPIEVSFLNFFDRVAMDVNLLSYSKSDD